MSLPDTEGIWPERRPVGETVEPAPPATLATQVLEAFAPEGLLSRTVASFQPRPGQTDMALAVAHAVAHRGVLVVEAGTGVGKTFSYLVPALLSGERVLLSTATKNLQDQLFGRDLPRLVSALGVPVRTAMLKGRASYLCMHRMEQARFDSDASNPFAARTLAKIEKWSQVTRTGDLAELPGLDERSPMVPLVTSSRDNCLGSHCPRFKACHVNLARREALAADVVVVNHHLFFADMAVRESGMAELLPTVTTVIFDEAHQLNETGVQFLGNNLSTGQVIDFAHDLLATGLQLARGLADWAQLASDAERAARDLRLTAGRAQAGSKWRWSTRTPEQVDPWAWDEALAGLKQACESAAEALDTVSEIAPDFVRLHERASQLAERVDFFAGRCAPDAVRWMDVGHQLRLVESPMDIAHAVKTRLLKASEPGGALPKSWIFTSATLGDDAQLRWFTEPCGLQDATLLKVGSPFDYPSQASVYVPTYLPKPNDPSHSLQVADLVARFAPMVGGRTLVLTTTLRALRAISEALQARFADTGALDILVQGQGTKRELLERFRRGSTDGEPGCVLVASASFWEGVDVPGDALQMVVIDKLPFPPPNDPLVEARAKRLEAAGRSPFNEYFVPEAAVALKQGAGRLIRGETDRGVLVVCDTRLGAMGYGKRLLAALPPMRRVLSEEDMLAVLDALAALTRTSTRDPASP